MDVIAVNQAGFENVVATLGTVSYTHLDVYKRQPQELPVSL